MSYHALKGKAIVDIISVAEQTTESGIVLIDRKSLPLKAKVVSVGDSYVNSTGKVTTAPIKEGDIVYFKRHTPKSLHSYGTDGIRSGLASIWWDEIVGVENS